jgi:DNA-directed RNA polymerase specialized sigma24 family protein
MTKNELLEKLAEKYDDWINMALSFKISQDDARELVQEMFIRIFDYVEKPDKLMYNETELNTFYVYVTLRNLFYSNTHKNSKKIVLVDTIIDEMIDEHYMPNYGEKSRKEYLEKVFGGVESLMETWYWYDKKMFELYYRTDMSMRDISDKTKITLSSIFNTLKNAKQQIRKNLTDGYEEYKKTKE